MGFEVSLHPEVVKFVKALNEGIPKRIKASLFLLKEDLFRRRAKTDIKKLKGTRGRQDLYRLRVGEYRIIYAIEGNEVLVTDIFKRGRGYRGF